uniref:UDP-glucose:glycoprotein glucosyltransferase n=2 Tax=Compsopogon caeruleus TaxID=31354 RepID=A0A7S1TGV7_9RHOD
MDVDLTTFRIDRLASDPPVIYLNDLENDAMYENWPADYRTLDQSTRGGTVIRSLIRLRKNIATFIAVFDASDSSQMEELPMLLSVVKQGLPIRIGLILLPGEVGSISEKVFSAVTSIALKDGGLKAAEFLTELVEIHQSSGPSSGASFAEENLMKEWTRRTSKPFSDMWNSGDIKTLISDSRRWAEFDDTPKADSLPDYTLNGHRVRDIRSELGSLVAGEQLRVAKLVAAKTIHPMSELPGSEAVRIGLEFAKKIDVDQIDYKKGRDTLSQALRNVELLSILGRISYVETSTDPNTTVWLVGDLGSAPLRRLAVEILEWIERDNSDARDRIRFAMFDSGQSSKCLEATPHRSSSLIQQLRERLDNESGSCEAAGHTFIQGVQSTAILKGIVDTSKPVLVLNGRVVPADRVSGIQDLTVLVRVEELVVASLSPRLRMISVDKRLALLWAALVIDRACSTRPDESSLPRDRVNQIFEKASGYPSLFITNSNKSNLLSLRLIMDPVAQKAAPLAAKLAFLQRELGVNISIILLPGEIDELESKTFHRTVLDSTMYFDRETGKLMNSSFPSAWFDRLPLSRIMTLSMDTPRAWMIGSSRSLHDLDNIVLNSVEGETLAAEFVVESLLVEGSCYDRSTNGSPPQGLKLQLWRPPPSTKQTVDTLVMKNLGYFQLKATSPGRWFLQLPPGRSKDLYMLDEFYEKNQYRYQLNQVDSVGRVVVTVDNLDGVMSAYLFVKRLPGTEKELLLDPSLNESPIPGQNISKETVNIFSVASGHLYERFMRIMMLSVTKTISSPVKFWMLANYLSPNFKAMLPFYAREYGFQYEFVTYRWPGWLREQTEKQRIIWAYKILFLDVLFPLSVRRIVFVDADQVVRGDLTELYHMDLKEAPYAYVPFCESRKEVEGFRFWKGGFWKAHLGKSKYHISALYLVDLVKFRETAAGDMLRYLYQTLSADPNSLSNLDQDLPNYAASAGLGESRVPIFSLPKDWLWCESWCDDRSKRTAKVIDLCNNPMTKEPKLAAATRIIMEWKDLDDEAAKVTERALRDAASQFQGGSVIEDPIHTEKDENESENLNGHDSLITDHDEL